MRPTLLCLHGWGGSKESFTELRAALEGSDVDVLTPDLPGFGAEAEPHHPWTVDDYADWVASYIEVHINDRPYALLGHSHGGRIAIKLVTRGTPYPHLPVHLYLCAAAGIRRPRHFKRITGLVLAKTGRAFLSLPGMKALQPTAKKLLYKLVRVHDYEKASPVMQQTLIKVSQEDLRPLLKNIVVPTDIFWGTDDGMTPYDDATIMQAEIPESTLHTYAGIRHRVHRDKANEIAEVIRATLPSA